MSPSSDRNLISLPVNRFRGTKGEDGSTPKDLEGQLYPRADPYRGWVLVPGPLPDALVILRKAVGLIDW
jgi:hypothetical protein